LNIQNATERYYIIYLPDSDATEQISRQEFKIPLNSLGIESYHRAIKQVCGIERFMVRKTEAIKLTFLVPSELFQLELMRAEELIENWYEVQRNLSPGST